MNAFLFIDGSNLYGGQYELFGPDYYLKVNLLIQYIEKNINVNFSKIFIYGSYSPIPSRPTKKQKSQLKNEGLFYKSIRHIDNAIFFKGYRSSTSGKEKEVDVKLAVDIVDMLHRDMFDDLYLFSGDADFMHALTIVKAKNKPITILALQNRIPFRFIHHFSTIIFGEEKSLRKHSVLKKAKKVIFTPIIWEAILGRI